LEEPEKHSQEADFEKIRNNCDTEIEKDESIENTSLEQTEDESVSDSIQDTQHVWWKDIIEFTVHIFVGIGIFILIAIPAIGLDLLLKWLSTIEISKFILIGLKIAELTIFSLDIILFLMYSANTSWKFISGLRWHGHE
jgi:hypothetical protein